MEAVAKTISKYRLQNTLWYVHCNYSRIIKTLPSKGLGMKEKAKSFCICVLFQLGE